MTQPPTRGVWLDEQTTAALNEYAWLKRTTKSEIFRGILEEIGTTPATDSVLSTPDRTGRKRLVVKTTDRQWRTASEAASRAGVGFHSLVRRHIIKVLMEEGLLE